MDEVKIEDTVRIRYKGEITKSDGEFMYDYDVLKKKAYERVTIPFGCFF